MAAERTGTPIVVTHERGLRFAAQIRHHRVVTDQTERAGGSASAPTPMELLAAAMASCVALYVHQFCVSRGLLHEGMRIEVTPINATSPNRIAQLDVAVHLPQELSPHVREMLERVVRSCPVHNTLAHGAAVTVAIQAGEPVHATA